MYYEVFYFEMTDKYKCLRISYLNDRHTKMCFDLLFYIEMTDIKNWYDIYRNDGHTRNLWYIRIDNKHKFAFLSALISDKG